MLKKSLWMALCFVILVLVGRATAVSADSLICEQEYPGYWTGFWSATVWLGPPPPHCMLVAGTEQTGVGAIVAGEHFTYEGEAWTNTDQYGVERTMGVFSSALYDCGQQGEISYWWHPDSGAWDEFWRWYNSSSGVYDPAKWFQYLPDPVGYCCGHETRRLPRRLGRPEDWGRRCDDLGQPVVVTPEPEEPKNRTVTVTGTTVWPELQLQLFSNNLEQPFGEAFWSDGNWGINHARMDEHGFRVCVADKRACSEPITSARQFWWGINLR